MTRVRYKDWSPTAEVAEKILFANEALASYAGRFTVRQIFYRFVAAKMVPNNQNEYDKIQDMLTKARYAGLIDWDKIEDRTRGATKSREWVDGKTALEEAAEQFRMDRWATQPRYIELWVEKDALAGILEPIAIDYHIVLMSNRGYSSASSMRESAMRIISYSQPTKEWPEGRPPTILYVGDHDPSGVHMVEDIDKRLREFGCPANLDVRSVAITMEQVRKYNPPDNPVKQGTAKKKGDARAAAYVAKFGEFCWEADALPPKTLDLIVRQAITAYIDRDKMKDAITHENLVKAEIKKFAASFKGAAT